MTHRGAIRKRKQQGGYVLLVIMLVATMMVIGSLAVARLYVGQIKRDQEVEMVHRGAQYARAIKKFTQKSGGRYPANLEALENTNQIRFLRRKYKDPITGQDFKLLHQGEVQLQPKSPTGGTNPGVSAASLSSGGAGQPGAQATSPLTTAAGAPVAGGSVGGAPIVGVASTSKKTSILEFDHKNHYDEWKFVYDRSFDRGGLIRGPYNGQSNVGIGGQPGGVVPPGGTPLPGGTTPPGGTPPRNPR